MYLTSSNYIDSAELLYAHNLSSLYFSFQGCPAPMRSVAIPCLRQWCNHHGRWLDAHPWSPIEPTQKLVTVQLESISTIGWKRKASLLQWGYYVQDKKIAYRCIQAKQIFWVTCTSNSTKSAPFLTAKLKEVMVFSRIAGLDSGISPSPSVLFLPHPRWPTITNLSIVWPDLVSA